MVVIIRVKNTTASVVRTLLNRYRLMGIALLAEVAIRFWKF